MRLHVAIVCSLLVLAWLSPIVSGASDPDQTKAPTTQPAAAQPQPNIGGNLDASPQNTGTIRGSVKFVGTKLPRKPVDLSTDAHCAKAATDPPLNEAYVWGDNDTLQNVLVYVVSGLDPKSPLLAPLAAPAPVTLDQLGCRFVPHVLAVRVDQPVIVRNGDDTLHNIRTLPTNNDAMNLGQPTQGHRHTVRFAKPELGLLVKCDVHPWMNAVVHVLDHPYFAVTAQTGTFEIRGLPPGQYELATLHELRAFVSDQQRYSVTVTAGQTSELTVTYSPKKPAK
jgi:hypothetical protein